MKCAHVLSIVTDANHNDAVCLFRSSFETQQIFEHWFSFNFDGLSQKKIAHLSKNQSAMANWASINNSIFVKSAFKNIISNSVLIVEAKPVKSRITENVTNFQIKLICKLIYCYKFYKVWKFHVSTTNLRNFIQVWKLPINTPSPL